MPINAGDTTFVLICTALVCMMTPALALFLWWAGELSRQYFGDDSELRLHGCDWLALGVWRL